MNKTTSERVEKIPAAVVESALRVHRGLGPGLLLSVYRTCLAHELESRGHHVRMKVELPVEYRGVSVDPGCEVEMVVDDLVVVENTAAEPNSSIHAVKIMTFLELGKKPLGFLLSWQVSMMRNGIRKFVLDREDGLRREEEPKNDQNGSSTG